LVLCGPKPGRGGACSGGRAADQPHRTGKAHARAVQMRRQRLADGRDGGCDDLRRLVDLTARLVNDKGEVAAARMFTVSIAAKSTAATDAVAAFNQAFSQVAGEIVVWAVGVI